MGAVTKRGNFWSRMSDEDLLDLRFCDLGLTIKGTDLERRIDVLYQQLDKRGLRFRPHFWLGEEWFSPEGVPGIAIPFYLAHPRLTKLEYRQMFEVEGGTHRSCMQLLRHETGHAIEAAYRLERRKRWKTVFGDPRKPYPDYYTPRPNSKRYVLNLDWWYAQSHPHEDFAETFAVWLGSHAGWRKQYHDWPALKKLEYLDELMQSVGQVSPRVRCRKQVEPISRIRRTLREHYAEKREHYEIKVPEVYDEDLYQLFRDPASGQDGKQSAASWLRRNKVELCQVCARGTGEHPYTFAQILQELIIRGREMGLCIKRPLDEVKIDTAIYLSVKALNHLYNTRHRIPV